MCARVRALADVRACANRAAKKPDSVITLSLIDTFNLLDPEQRIMRMSELKAMATADLNAAEAAEKAGEEAPASRVDEWQTKYCKAQQAACKGLVKFMVENTSKAESGDASDDDEADGGGADEAAAAATKKKGTPKKPKIAYIEEEAGFGIAVCDQMINPKEIRVAHEKDRYQPITKSQLLWNAQTLAGESRDPVARTDVVRFAIQRAGRVALLGNFDVIGGLVTYPGECESDVDPSKLKVLKDDDDALDLGVIDDVEKVAINKAACIYPDWSRVLPDKSMCPRVVKVERIKITLARYIAELETQLKKAAASKANSVKKENVAISINKRLAIARSYTTDKPATKYVLPGAKAAGRVDPEKVVLDLYAYRMFNVEELGKVKLFDDAKTPIAEPKMIDTLLMLARHENQVYMAIDVVVHDEDDDTKRTPMRVLCAVPIVSFASYYYELTQGKYSEAMLKTVDAGRAAITAGSKKPKWPTKKELGLEAAFAKKPADGGDDAAAAKTDDAEEKQPAAAAKKSSIKKTPAKSKTDDADDDVDDKKPAAAADADDMAEDDTPPPTKGKGKKVVSEDDADGSDLAAKAMATAAKVKVSFDTPKEEEQQR